MQNTYARMIRLVTTIVTIWISNKWKVIVEIYICNTFAQNGNFNTLLLFFFSVRKCTKTPRDAFYIKKKKKKRKKEERKKENRIYLYFSSALQKTIIINRRQSIKSLSDWTTSFGLLRVKREEEIFYQKRESL